jgi:putative cell wall-binding protein
MKKLMSLMLGMALAFTTVAVVFAQDTAKKEDTAKKKASKKKKDTAAPAPKKDR